MNHDPNQALELYVWNAKIGETFHTPIQATEIALRNRINSTLLAKYGDNWWSEPAFVKLADRERQLDLDTVKRRIERRGLPLVTDQIVAGLSFGFWVGVLHLDTTRTSGVPTSKSHFPTCRRVNQEIVLQNWLGG